MTPLVAIWIDHEKAVLAFAGEGHVETKTIHSDVAGHPRWSGSQEGGGEKKYEARHAQHLARFYDDVIHELESAGSLHLFGPGEAKRELQERLKHVKHLAQLPVRIETSDRMTEAQVAAKAREQLLLLESRVR